MAELDTAVRHGLDYIAVIGNDATWNAEYQIQLRAYGKDRAKGCELLPTRYGAVASALAAHGEDVFTPAELQSALRRAAAAGKPACVNVMIERLPAPRYD
jgi:acetolactate synthase-1/2/3 large subunit